MQLKDKVMIITGASGGIGAATARLLGSRGMKCVLTARSESGLKRIAGELPAAAVIAGDMIDPKLPGRLIDAAMERFGRLDVVFNNAGVMHIGSVEDADVEALCAMVRLNVEAVVRMSYAALRHFKGQASGFLINTSSLAGLKSFPQIGPYCGTKFAVGGIDRGAAHGIGRNRHQSCRHRAGPHPNGLVRPLEGRSEIRPLPGFDRARCNCPGCRLHSRTTG
jgi:NADP-dependent 3-hydroxy acid dehydrogenase YdfG